MSGFGGLRGFVGGGGGAGSGKSADPGVECEGGNSSRAHSEEPGEVVRGEEHCALKSFMFCECGVPQLKLTLRRCERCAVSRKLGGGFRDA